MALQPVVPSRISLRTRFPIARPKMRFVPPALGILTIGLGGIRPKRNGATMIALRALDGPADMPQGSFRGPGRRYPAISKRP